MWQTKVFSWILISSWRVPLKYLHFRLIDLTIPPLQIQALHTVYTLSTEYICLFPYWFWPGLLFLILLPLIELDVCTLLGPPPPLTWLTYDPQKISRLAYFNFADSTFQANLQHTPGICITATSPSKKYGKLEFFKNILINTHFHTMKNCICYKHYGKRW